jgi:HepT-like protein
LRNFRVLKLSIQDEIGRLALLDREKNALVKRRSSNYLVRAGGSILHDFYTGIEKIFESIAKEIDNRIPMGEEWHSELLRQMTLDIPGLRPPVITASTEKKLREYLGFRHLFRKRYGFELHWQKLKKLLLGVPQVRTQLEKEIRKFFDDLDSIFGKKK